MVSIKRILKRISAFVVTKRTVINIQQLPKGKMLSGRCALITGGTSGIGLSIAKAFLNEGATVIITGRTQERLNNTISELNASNKVYGFVLDNTKVSDFDSVLSNILRAIQKNDINGIDILVNNAGINCRGMPYATEDEFDKVMNTNLKGTFFMSQLFGKYMVDNHIKGNILNISSASSIRPADSAYTLSKWGIRGLTLGLAKALASNGITVNAIAPGPTATPMMIRGEENDLSLDRIPLGRYIMPEEIANMAVYLVSDLGRSIMGDTIYMTGGAGLLTYDDVKYSF